MDEVYGLILYGYPAHLCEWGCTIQVPMEVNYCGVEEYGSRTGAIRDKELQSRNFESEKIQV